MTPAPLRPPERYAMLDARELVTELDTLARYHHTAPDYEPRWQACQLYLLVREFEAELRASATRITELRAQAAALLEGM